MNIYNVSKKIGKLLGKSSKVLQEGCVNLKEGYKEGLINKCPVCKKVVSKSDIDIESIRRNKMCCNCMFYKNSQQPDD